MKILQIIVGLNVGGAELMLKRLLEAHQDNPGYQHTVISLTTLGTIGPQLRAAGLTVVALNMASPLQVPRVMWELVRAIRAIGPDIVQTWMYHADLLGGIAARLAGCRRVIWGVRTTDVKSGNARTTTLLMHVCAILSRTIPHTIVCAAEASARSHVDLGYDASKIVVVPNGFDAARLCTTEAARRVIRDLCNCTNDTLLVGTLGRFNEAKDHENFVRAAGMLAAVHPEARFVMVGRDLDGGNTVLHAWIQQTGFSDRFVLLGERPDVAACLAAMDVFCLSSRSEGFPNVVGEAMGMGVPCVTTDVGDAGLLVGDSGVIVPMQDSGALAAGLASVLALPADARRALGAAAKRRIWTEFTMERSRERFEAVYQRVAGKGVL